MFDKSEIMRNAWSIRRTANVNMSIALRSAWALAKATNTAEEMAAGIDWNTRVKVNGWAKGGHNRTYVEVRVYTNAWNCKHIYEIGYVNNLTGEFIAA